MSRDSKEIFEQRFVKVLEQNWKHVEARNQGTGASADFTVPKWDCQNCAGAYFKKNCRLLDLQLYSKETQTQVVSCEYCKIFNTIYFEKHLQTAAF